MVFNNKTSDKVINTMDKTFFIVGKKYQLILKKKQTNTISATGFHSTSLEIEKHKEQP